MVTEEVGIGELVASLKAPIGMARKIVGPACGGNQSPRCIARMRRVPGHQPNSTDARVGERDGVCSDLVARKKATCQWVPDVSDQERVTVWTVAMTRWGPPGSEPAHELDWLGRADHGNGPRGGFRPRRAGVPYFSRFFSFFVFFSI